VMFVGVAVAGTGAMIPRLMGKLFLPSGDRLQS